MKLNIVRYIFPELNHNKIFCTLILSPPNKLTGIPKIDALPEITCIKFKELLLFIRAPFVSIILDENILLFGRALILDWIKSSSESISTGATS